jgi:hypothetical protein
MKRCAGWTTACRQVANTIAGLIIGGLLATEVDAQADEPDEA